MRLDRIVLLYLLSKFNGTEAFTFHPHVKPVPKIPCGSLKPKLNMAMWIPDPLITPHFTQGVVVSLAQATALLLFNQKSLTKAGLFHATILSIVSYLTPLLLLMCLLLLLLLHPVIILFLRDSGLSCVLKDGLFVFFI